jgi:hypothetical protein
MIRRVNTSITTMTQWLRNEFITTKIVFTNRSVAALQENDLANRRPPMRTLIATLGRHHCCGLFQMPIAA